jgi:hypothetical protein
VSSEKGQVDPGLLEAGLGQAEVKDGVEPTYDDIELID